LANLGLQRRVISVVTVAMSILGAIVMASAIADRLSRIGAHL
jgi:hypothetical protein